MVRLIREYMWYLTADTVFVTAVYIINISVIICCISWRVNNRVFFSMSLTTSLHTLYSSIRLFGTDFLL